MATVAVPVLPPTPPSWQARPCGQLTLYPPSSLLLKRSNARSRLLKKQEGKVL